MSRATGFRPLRPGRIHMRCPRCGRKQSNVVRQKFDHPTAFMFEELCDKCDHGCKDIVPDYFDKRGRRLRVPYDRW